MTSADVYAFAKSHAPVTRRLAFLNGSFDAIVEFSTEWLVPHGFNAPKQLLGSFNEAVGKLFPCNGRRWMFIQCRNKWTAFLWNANDSLQLKAGHIASGIRCRAINCCVVEDSYDSKSDAGELGCVQFTVGEPFKTEFQNIGRCISVTNDHDGWSFEASGEALPFEQVDHYKSSNVRDRFTPEMLHDYLEALGIDAFRPEFYGPRCAYFERTW